MDKEEVEEKMRIKIRKAEKTDLKEIAKIFKTEYAKKPYNEKWTKKNALRKIKNYFNNNIIYIAELDNKLIGFIIAGTFLWDRGKVAIINEIVISKEFQGQGIGGILLNKGEDYFKNKKINEIFLFTNPSSKAYNIYRHFGYKDNNFIQMRKKLK